MSTHQTPADGEGLTPCCGRTPFELPTTDRLTTNPYRVDCPATVASLPVPHGGVASDATLEDFMVPEAHDDRAVRRGSGAYIVGWHDDGEDTVVVSVWPTQAEAEADRERLHEEMGGRADWLVVEGWHGRDSVVLS